MYIAYLSPFLTPQLVCCYLNFVGILCKEVGFSNPLLSNWVLEGVLRGLKRSCKGSGTSSEVVYPLVSLW